MMERYWLVLPNGARQLIDPQQFDLASIQERARRVGGQLVFERTDGTSADRRLMPAPPVLRMFEPPVAALAPLFRARFERLHICRAEYTLDINQRPTTRVLGGYYRKRRLVRIYSHDRQTGRRPLEELFDTFLHEMAHHLEYTEPHAFDATACERVKGRMHSPLFWQILRDLKRRWSTTQRVDAHATAAAAAAGAHAIQGTLFDLDS